MAWVGLSGVLSLAARPIKIAQISDLHITPHGTLAYGCVDTAADLTRAVDTRTRPDLGCDFR
jgi:hypothetical protein